MNLSVQNSRNLQMAAQDFRCLLDRGYPRKPSLELVGNRYQLTYDQRHLLHRGVFSEEDSKRRRSKKISLSRVRGKDLAIDGYNVLITLEGGLSGRSLILGDDGFIRDISGLSGNYRKSDRTEEAFSLIFKVLKKAKPRHTLFLFDSPISKSGELAQEVRRRLRQEGLLGDARTMGAPEKTLNRYPGVVATTDTAIIDQSIMAVDLSGHILKHQLKLASVISWRKLSFPLKNFTKAIIPRSPPNKP